MNSKSKLTDYELARLKRIEDNKKFMQDLGVLETKNELDKSLEKEKPLRTQPKIRKPAAKFPVRSSSRVAAMVSKPSYRDLDGEPAAFSGRRRSGEGRVTLGGFGGNRSLARKNVPYEAISEAQNSAEKMAATLTNPCLIKSVVPSQMSGGFWMGLSAGFCKDYLPNDECTMILEDPDGKQWETIYKAEKTALSGGWRGYALDHKLDAGDALLFELIEPTKMKVYVFRAIDQPSAKQAKEENNEVEEGVKEEEEQKYMYDRSQFSVKIRETRRKSGRGGNKKGKKKETWEVESDEEEEEEDHPTESSNMEQSEEASSDDVKSEDEVNCEQEDSKISTKVGLGKCSEAENNVVVLDSDSNEDQEEEKEQSSGKRPRRKRQVSSKYQKR